MPLSALRSVGLKTDLLPNASCFFTWVIGDIPHTNTVAFSHSIDAGTASSPAERPPKKYLFLLNHLLLCHSHLPSCAEESPLRLEMARASLGRFHACCITIFSCTFKSVFKIIVTQNGLSHTRQSSIEHSKHLHVFELPPANSMLFSSYDHHVHILSLWNFFFGQLLIELFATQEAWDNTTINVVHCNADPPSIPTCTSSGWNTALLKSRVRILRLSFFSRT